MEQKKLFIVACLATVFWDMKYWDIGAVTKDSFCETAFLLCRHTCQELGIGLPDSLTMVEPIVRSAPALFQSASSVHSFVKKKMTCMQWSKQTPIPFYVNFMLPKIPLELYETRNFKNGDKRTESWFLGVRFATKFVNMLKRNCAFWAGKEFYSKKRKSIWSLVGISFPATSDFAALCCFRCLINISDSKNNFRW